MKGGVGKTTIFAHVMRVLYQWKHKKVLLVDLDPQFNLTQGVISRHQYDGLKSQNKTIFTAMEPPSDVGLFDVATTPNKPPPASDVAITLLCVTNTDVNLSLIPGNFELVKYSLVTDHHKLELVKKRFLTFIRAARAEYDVIVIDCNPSSSFYNRMRS
jgi:chromosome partitioning protein